jgi:hypothetical protein
LLGRSRNANCPYHETITIAYPLLIAEWLDECPGAPG